jgi:hypothetical protein
MNQYIIISKNISRYVIPSTFLISLFSQNIASFLHYCLKPFNDILYDKSGWRFEYGELLSHRYEIFPTFYEVIITTFLLIVWWYWQRSFKNSEEENFIKKFKDEFHSGNEKKNENQNS